MGEGISEPLARRIRSGDWAKLAAFECTTGSWYEDGVEQFVRQRLRSHVERYAPYLQTMVVVLAAADETEDIIAIGAHELDDQVTGSGEAIAGSYLIVGAVSRDLQGVRVDMAPFADGRPVTVGRLLMETMIDDLPRPGLVRAVVARENVRSLKLRDRLGLRREDPDPDERYVQRLGKVT